MSDSEPDAARVPDAARGDKARMTRREWIAILLFLTLVGWAPLLGVVIADTIATYAGCVLNEGSVHACRVAGLDIGPALYHLMVSGWLMLVTWPLMLASIPTWIVVLVRWGLRRDDTDRTNA